MSLFILPRITPHPVWEQGIPLPDTEISQGERQSSSTSTSRPLRAGGGVRLLVSHKQIRDSKNDYAARQGRGGIPGRVSIHSRLSGI